jgi:hypothetical protein
MRTENRRRESLIVRRRGYRWCLAAAYFSMLIILSVTLSGIAFDGSGITKITAWRTIK